jgi:segregation and condensation protein A
MLSRPVRWLPVTLGVFQGPLDLLLHLIEENEIDIYDIPIAQITDQYVGYLRAMEELDLEIASEFIVMAATLMEIKTRMLLPKPRAEAGDEPAPDPRRGLVDMLLEYRRFRELADHLGNLHSAQCKRFARGAAGAAGETQVELGDLSLYDILQTWRRLADKHRPVFSKIVRESVSVRQKMAELMRAVARAARNQAVLFSHFVRSAVTRREVVVAFLALLELVRRRRLRAEQDGLFGDVRIFSARRRNTGTAEG